MADGWIKVWRKLADSQMWLEKPFSKGQAWIDLLLLATSTDHVSKYKGRSKSYKAGTVHFSLCFLTERWGWSRNKVYRFIERLQREGMLEYQGRTSNGTTSGTENETENDTTNGTTSDTVLIVVNWSLYQSRQSKNGTINDTTNDTVDEIPKRTRNGTHPKNDIYPKKNTKEEKKNPPKSPQGDKPPSGKNDSHLRLSADEGTVDDIPDRYRSMFDNFADYWNWRNQ